MLKSAKNMIWFIKNGITFDLEVKKGWFFVPEIAEMFLFQIKNLWFMEKPVKPRKTGFYQKWVFLVFLIKIRKIWYDVNGAKLMTPPGAGETFNTQFSSPNFVDINSLPKNRNTSLKFRNYTFSPQKW